MNSRLLVWFSWFYAGAALQAGPMKLAYLTVGPTTYQDVTVMGANETDLFFAYQRGMMNVKLKYLDTDLQRRFHYDPDQADRAEHRRSQQELAFRNYVASNIVAHAAAVKAAREEEAKAADSSKNLMDPISDKSLLGKPAPALKPADWMGDKPSLDGKFVLIDFLAPWSSSCRKYIPELNDLQKKFGDKLVVIGITAQSKSELSQMDEPAPEFSCAIDPKSDFSAAAGVTSVPCVMLLDPQHIVRYQGHPGALTSATIETLLNQAAE